MGTCSACVPAWLLAEGIPYKGINSLCRWRLVVTEKCYTPRISQKSLSRVGHDRPLNTNSCADQPTDTVSVVFIDQWRRPSSHRCMLPYGILLTR